MASIGKLIASVGALSAGYLKGKDIAEDQQFEREQRAQVRQDWEDRKALRDAISGGIYGGTPSVASTANESGVSTDGAPSTAAGNSASTDSMGSVASSVVAKVPATAMSARQPSLDEGAQDDYHTYVNRVAPRAMKTLVSQGRFQEAKALNDFLETSQGQSYTRAWGQAMRRVAAGDFDGAVPQLEKLYSSVPDGKRAKATSLGEGKYRIDMLDEKTGDVLGSREMTSGDLSRQAVMALDPSRMASIFVQNQADRERESSVLDRQIKLEKLKQEGADVRDDRREERLQLRLDAQGRALDRRLAASSGDSELTVSQQRTNESIIAARRQVTGMSQDEALRRTQATTATGRENPEFDPALARTLKLAQSRLYGDDPSHDAFSSARSSTGQRGSGQGRTPLQEAQAALASDPNMAGYSLGEQAANGFKVLDANGRHVGYFGRR